MPRPGNKRPNYPALSRALSARKFTLLFGSLFLGPALVYNIYPSFWAGLGSGYGFGGESTIDGVNKHDHRETISWAATLGFPVGGGVSGNVDYIGSQAQEDVGSNSDSIILTLLTSW